MTNSEKYLKGISEKEQLDLIIDIATYLKIDIQQVANFFDKEYQRNIPETIEYVTFGGTR